VPSESPALSSKIFPATLGGEDPAAWLPLGFLQSESLGEPALKTNQMRIHQAKQNGNGPPRRRVAGMTLVEVVVALGISGLTVGAIVAGYLFCVTSAEKSALSLAANAMALERLEQARSASWNTVSWPVVDQLVSSNFANTVSVLDLSGTGPGVTYATNITTIFQISTNPPLKQVRVDCIWPFSGNRVYTNSIEMCRAPDQ
jgi:type II secretory pathway pseudopilin PulG